MSASSIDIARAAGRAAFNEAPTRPLALAEAVTCGPLTDTVLDAAVKWRTWSAFREGHAEARAEYERGLTPRGRTLYRFDCRRALDRWQKKVAG